MKRHIISTVLGSLLLFIGVIVCRKFNISQETSLFIGFFIGGIWGVIRSVWIKFD